MHIVFIVPYPLGNSPSQRFRFEQYFQFLTKNKHEYAVYPFLTPSGWKILYSKGKTFRKLLLIIAGFIRRIGHIFFCAQTDYVFIHREAAPIGPPIFEWLIAKVLRRRIIYDFDDTIWLPDVNSKQDTRFLERIRFREKTNLIIRWSYRVSAGNTYLASHAQKFNSSVTLNPTTIDTDNLHNPELYSLAKRQHVTIGWTGSHSTLVYLHLIEDVMIKIKQKYPEVQFVVIANRKPALSIPDLRFVEWTKSSEIKDLMTLDVGVMPLSDDAWSGGKCGFKILQYMALSIPAVASPVGANSEIIMNGINGYLANSDEEWFSTLSALIESAELRNKLGAAGRLTVEQHYSVSSNVSTFLSLFEPHNSISPTR